jgi:anti-anti-sigma factor
LARIQSSGKAVVFDLEAVSFLSSAFLSLCISAAKESQGDNRLRLVNVGPELKKVLKIAGLDEGLLSISPREG